MFASESLDPEEPGDPSPHELGVYICVQYTVFLTYVRISIWRTQVHTFARILLL